MFRGPDIAGAPTQRLFLNMLDDPPICPTCANDCKCQWRVHSVDRYRPLIPNMRLCTTSALCRRTYTVFCGSGGSHSYVNIVFGPTRPEFETCKLI